MDHDGAENGENSGHRTRPLLLRPSPVMARSSPPDPSRPPPSNPSEPPTSDPSGSPQPDPSGPPPSDRSLQRHPRGCKCTEAMLRLVDDVPMCKKPRLAFDINNVPEPGRLVPEKHVRKAGPYLLGPKVGPSPVKSIVQCLARKEKTDEYYQLKIFTFKNDDEPETQDYRQGKMLMHTEVSLLSLLKDREGVIQHHGLFKVRINKKKIITYILL